MLRNVYLEGELALRFGEVVSVFAKSVKDVFLVLEANDPSVKNYVIKCAEKGISFSVTAAGKEYEKEEDLVLPMKEGDVFISTIPAGSKSAGAKILTAIAIATLFVVAPQALMLVNASGALTFGGTMLASLGVNLALAGIQQALAPDPAVDKDQDKSYLFNGQEQNIVQGDPVPLAYGRLRVPGRPISFDVVNDTLIVSNNGAELHNIAQATGENYQGILEDILVEDEDGNHKKTLPLTQEF
jgi:predicted phage tail protein